MNTPAYKNLVKDIEDNFRFIYLNHLKSEDYYFVIIRVSDKYNYYLQAMAERGKTLHLEIPSNHYVIKQKYNKKDLKKIKGLGWSNVSVDKMHEIDFDIMQTPINQVAQIAANTLVNIFSYNYEVPLGYEIGYQAQKSKVSKRSYITRLKDFLT